jgi:hypothetical protein
MKPATAQIRKSQGIKVNRVTSGPFGARAIITHEIGDRRDGARLNERLGKQRNGGSE